MSHRTIHLFRKGLRLHDNPGLQGALASSAALFPVFVLDRALLEETTTVASTRWRFILQSLEDLDARLRALGSRLYVLRGSTATVLRDLVTRWSVTQISYDTEVEPYHARVEREIQALAEERGMQTHTCVSHTLYDVQRIIQANGGSPPLTYKKFLHVLSVLGEPEKPTRDVSAEDFLRCPTPADPELAYGVPSLADLGLEVQSETLWPGGETHALQRLHTHFQSQGWLSSFSKPRTVPNSLLPSTTALSPYLSLGCLSVRTFYHRLSSVYAQVRLSKGEEPLAAARVSPGPGPVARVLLHRCVRHAKLHQDGGEPDLPADPLVPRARVSGEVENRPHRVPLDRRHHDPAASGGLDPSSGSTRRGLFPDPRRPVDQLGGGHEVPKAPIESSVRYFSRLRVCSQVFEEFLLDADYSLNAGNWMWLSASAFFHKYTRIFCPVRFGRRTDPQGQYLRKYLPVLKNFPSQYIYEPWKAPKDVQLSAGCIIGKDYPCPMVCHTEASQRNLGLMRQVRTEQQKTAELTRDVTDDPMEAGLKRELQEEEELLEGAEPCSRSKRLSGSADHKSRPSSWTLETVRLSEDVT